MTIDFKDIKRVLSQPIWIVITVVLQFTIMPLIAFFLIKLLNIDFELALGFIILGSCPGGTASNVHLGIDSPGSNNNSFFNFGFG